MYKKHQIRHYFIKLIIIFIICSINIFAQTESNITDSNSSVDSIDIQTDLFDQSIDQQQVPNTNNGILLNNITLEETQNIDETANLSNIENYIKQAQVCLDNNVLDNIFVDEIYDCLSECNILQGTCVSFLFNTHNKNCILRKSLIGNCSVDLSEQGFGGWYQFDNQNNIDINVDSDSDGDGVINSQDNCLDVPNPGQEDSNGNNIGDACEIHKATYQQMEHVCYAVDSSYTDEITNETSQEICEERCNNDVKCEAYVYRTSDGFCTLRRNLCDCPDIKPNGTEDFIQYAKTTLFKDNYVCPDIDSDGDGYRQNSGDCNDLNKDINPGAEEICGDGIDNNCNNQIDEDSICSSDSSSEQANIKTNESVDPITIQIKIGDECLTAIATNLGNKLYVEPCDTSDPNKIKQQSFIYSNDMLMLGLDNSKCIDSYPGKSNVTDYTGVSPYIYHCDKNNNNQKFLYDSSNGLVTRKDAPLYKFTKNNTDNTVWLQKYDDISTKIDLEFYKNNYPHVKFLAKAIFNLDFYKEKHQNLSSNSHIEIMSYWLSKGIDNGEAGSPYFDINYYRNNNADIANYTNTALIEHWIKNGFKENRNSSPIMSPAEIKSKITADDLIVSDQTVLDYASTTYDGTQAITRVPINMVCKTNEQCTTGLCDNDLCKAGHNQFSNSCINLKDTSDCAIGLSCSDYGTCIDPSKPIVFSNYPITNDYRTKGILTDYFHPREELINAKIGRININFYWSDYEANNKSICNKDEDYFEGHCYKKRDFEVEEVKYYSDHDVIVTAIVLGTPDWAMKNNASKCYKSKDPYFRKFCTPDNPEDYARFAKYLAHKFNGKNNNGRASEFIIYNEVNSRAWWDSACGDNCTIANITDAYSKLYNTAYDYIKSENKEAVVLIPIEHHFFDKISKQDGANDHIGSGDFILNVAGKLGNRKWQIAHHPYPPDLTKAEFSVNDYPKITFGNIGLLIGWLMQNFPDKPHAYSVRLTEQGVNSMSNSNEDLQNKMVCESYINILGTPYVDSYNYHRMSDNVDEVKWNTAMGLRHPDGKPKPSWNTWSIASDNSAMPTRLNCGFENLPFVKLSRYYNNTESVHWATSRKPPRYSSSPYNLEASWKLLKHKLDNTKLLYECRTSHKSKNNYVSTNVNCNNSNYINYGPVGYIFTSPNSNTVALYNCKNKESDTFLSISNNCELLNISGELLGYVLPNNFNKKFILRQYSSKYDRNIVSPHSIRRDYQQLFIWLLSSIKSAEYNTALYECKDDIDSMGTYLTKNSNCLKAEHINYGIIGYIALVQVDNSVKLNTCKRKNKDNIDDYYVAESCSSDENIEELGYFNNFE